MKQIAKLWVALISLLLVISIADAQDKTPPQLQAPPAKPMTNVQPGQIQTTQKETLQVSADVNMKTDSSKLKDIVLPIITAILLAGSGLGGAFLGGHLSTKGSLRLQREEREHQERSLASAFLGEITALVFCQHAHKRTTQVYLDRLRDSGNTYPFEVLTMSFDIYESNIKRIGIFDVQLTRLIALFYLLSKSMLNSFKRDQERAMSQSPETLENFYKGYINLAENAIRLGNRIIQLIQSKYNIQSGDILEIIQQSSGIPQPDPPDSSQ